jgi:flagellar export protein FliJ
VAAECAGPSADYAAFLPRALVERDGAAQAASRAAAAAAVARSGLAEARLGERAVTMLVEQRAEARREKAARREQARLDDWRRLR